MANKTKKANKFISVMLVMLLMVSCYAFGAGAAIAEEAGQAGSANESLESVEVQILVSEGKIPLAYTDNGVSTDYPAEKGVVNGYDQEVIASGRIE